MERPDDFDYDPFAWEDEDAPLPTADDIDWNVEP